MSTAQTTAQTLADLAGRFSEPELDLIRLNPAGFAKALKDAKNKALKNKVLTNANKA